MLGDRAWGHRMVGVNGSTELCAVPTAQCSSSVTLPNSNTCTTGAVLQDFEHTSIDLPVLCVTKHFCNQILFFFESKRSILFQFSRNCISLYGNFSTCQSAIMLDIQNHQDVLFFNNFVSRNLGGLYIRYAYIQAGARAGQYIRNYPNIT